MDALDRTQGLGIQDIAANHYLYSVNAAEFRSNQIEVAPFDAVGWEECDWACINLDAGNTCKGENRKCCGNQPGYPPSARHQPAECCEQ